MVEFWPHVASHGRTGDRTEGLVIGPMALGQPEALVQDIQYDFARQFTYSSDLGVAALRSPEQRGKACLPA